MRAARGEAEAIEELERSGVEAGQGVAKGKGVSKEDKKRGLVGKKGQKLQKGVLPGGGHAVGKINERARHNKELAQKSQQKANQNLRELEEI